MSLAAALAANAPAQTELVRSVTPARVIAHRGIVDVPIEQIGDPAGSSLALTTGERPVAVLPSAGLVEGFARFAGPALQSLDTDPNSVRAIWIGGSALENARRRWPAEGPFLASICGVSPGARRVWLDAGANLEVRTGDLWLLSSGDQPVARLETRLVEKAVSYAEVTPLVRDLRLSDGDRAVFWMRAAGERGALESRVVHVEQRETMQRVWLAAPPGQYGDARVDLYRGREHLGFGPADIRDDRFWIASLLRGATHDAVRIGDLAHVRFGWWDAATRAREGVRARIFELTPHALASAGELDALTPGETGLLVRAGAPVGIVEIEQLQPTYARVRPREGAALALRDEVLFGQPTSGQKPPAGEIISAVAELVVVRWRETRPLGDSPRLIRGPDGQAVAVGVPFGVAGTEHLLWAPARGVRRAPAVGDVVE